MATISRQRMDVCVCVCNCVYSVCTGKGSSQSKHKHKRSCVSPSRTEPTIVGTLHTPPQLGRCQAMEEARYLGYAAFAATVVEGNDVFGLAVLGSWQTSRAS